jgi:hypothetical protein
MAPALTDEEGDDELEGDEEGVRVCELYEVE